MGHVARTELRAGAMVDARLDSMRDLASTLPKDARVMALDDQFELGCIPLIYFGIGNAMKPPFVPAGLPRVLWWESMETLPRGGFLDEHPGTIVIARLSEGRYVERHPRIPGLPGSLPSLAAVPDEPGTWRFAAPIPARAVAAVVVAAGSAGTFECTWIGSRGKRATRGALPGLGGDPRAIVSAPRDFDWLADPVLLGVRLEGVEARSVDPLAELPEIRIAAPAALARIPVGVPDVAFELPSQARSDEYRLTIEFAFSQDERPLMIWEEPAGALTTLPNGTVTFGARQRAPSFVAGKPMDAEAFGARLHAVLAASGAGVVPISLRVEGFDPRSGSIQCRSSWRNCFLERRD
jgi:hypothetical protein